MKFTEAELEAQRLADARTSLAREVEELRDQREELLQTRSLPTLRGALTIPAIKELIDKLLLIDQNRRRLSPLIDLIELCNLAKAIVAKAGMENEL